MPRKSQQAREHVAAPDSTPAQAFRALKTANTDQLIDVINNAQDDSQWNTWLPEYMQVLPGKSVLQPLLHKLAASGCMPAIDALLAKPGVHIDQPDAEGATALSYAVLGKKPLDVLQLLVEKGASTHCRTDTGALLIHTVCLAGARSCLQWMLRTDEHLNVNQQTSLGFTPLMFTLDDDDPNTLEGRLGCAQLLLKHNADLNIQDNDGNTVIHWATFNLQAEILRLLLQHADEAVDLSIKNSLGQTAFDVAIDLPENPANVFVVELLAFQMAKSAKTKKMREYYCNFLEDSELREQVLQLNNTLEISGIKRLRKSSETKSKRAPAPKRKKTSSKVVKRLHRDVETDEKEEFEDDQVQEFLLPPVVIADLPKSQLKTNERVDACLAASQFKESDPVSPVVSYAQSSASQTVYAQTHSDARMDILLEENAVDTFLELSDDERSVRLAGNALDIATSQSVVVSKEPAPKITSVETISASTSSFSVKREIDVEGCDKELCTRLFEAIDRNDVSAVKELVSPNEAASIINVAIGAVEDRENMSPLSFACFLGNVDIALHLILCGADVLQKDKLGANCMHRLFDERTSDARAHSCLLELLELADEEVKEKIMTALGDRDVGGWTPIVYSVFYRKYVCTSQLLRILSDPHKPDLSGNTPFMWAAFKGYSKMIEIFLEYCELNPTVSKKSKKGVTVFDLNHKNHPYGNTALHYAAYRAHVSSRFKECVRLLVDAGASLDVFNARFQLACDLVHIEEIKYRNLLTPQNVGSLREQTRIRRENEFSASVVFQDGDIASGKEKFPIRWTNDVDSEEAPPQFVYITQVVAGKNVALPGPSTSSGNCLCGWTGGCLSESSKNRCQCMFLNDRQLRCTDETNGSMEFYVKTQKKKWILSGTALSSHIRIYECNEACTCLFIDCPNRLVQRGVQHRLELFKTRKKGWALRTLEPIPKGSFVIEYIGEIISEEEAEIRLSQRNGVENYIWSLQPESQQVFASVNEGDGSGFTLCREGDDSKSKALQERFAIDPSFFGNAARFMSHSCEPNLIAKEVFVYHRDHRFPRMALFAVRDVLAFEELTFDYGYVEQCSPSGCLRCECGSPSCRITLL
jgi:ankyrin repeat protein